MTSDTIIEQASEWFVTLRYEEVDASVQERFMDWLRESPEHVRAYLSVVDLWTDLPSVDSQQRINAQTHIARALAEGNVVSLGSLPKSDAVMPPKRKSRPRLLAASIAVLFIGLGAVWFAATRPPAYATDIGEQRTLRLADGSTVVLNSSTRIRVVFTDHDRIVDLIQGQALFHVAKDPGRVFLVRSDTARIRAVGTQFDVYRKPGGTVVTVVEGRVAVADSVFLSAGDQITVAPKAPLHPVKANVVAATAWTQGQLMFRSAPLSAVVDEFNRYNTRRLILSKDVEDFPITAVFSSTDPGMLVEFLSGQPEIAVHAGDREIRIETRK